MILIKKKTWRGIRGNSFPCDCQFQTLLLISWQGQGGRALAPRVLRPWRKKLGWLRQSRLGFHILPVAPSHNHLITKIQGSSLKKGRAECVCCRWCSAFTTATKLLGEMRVGQPKCSTKCPKEMWCFEMQMLMARAHAHIQG